MPGLSNSTVESLKRIVLLLGVLSIILYAGDKLDLGNHSKATVARLFEKPTGRPNYSGSKTQHQAVESQAGVLEVAPNQHPNTRLLAEHAEEVESVDTGANANSNPETADKPAEHESGEALIVYIIAILMLLGGACREIKKLTGLPYTPQLLFFGILIGSLTEHLGTIGHAFKLLLNINPHGILMIFIPTIIFESAYNSDPFTTKRQIWQILLLAGPGVIVGAILITLGFNFGLGYYTELSFSGGLTFGAIVCATDPVAVVALLKELGTPVKFNMLLEGESLLNDGTAMVFYLVFSSIFKAQGVTVLGIVWKFLQLSVGGLLLGAVTFIFAIAWIRKIVKDDILTIAITFISCYLSFFIGETYLGVSGILTIVALGVLMSMYGKVRINPESEHSVHMVWSFIQYVLETVIFVLTGGYIGYYTIASKSSTITTSDWVRMFLFYFVMTAARYLMILIFSPIMNKTGYPVTQKDMIVLTYGGLRGAIALCLGLIVYGDDDYSPRFRDLVLFYLAGMITLTVLFNGLTMKWLMKKIEFTPPNHLREKFKQNIQKHMVVTSIKAQQKIKDNRFLQMAAWEDVFGLCGTDEIIVSQMALKKQEEQDMRELVSKNDQNKASPDETLIEIRYRVYRLIKAQFWSKFEENFCSSAVVTVLNESIDMCMDDLPQKLWVYECISESLISGEKLQNLLAWRNTPVLGKFARSFLNGYLLNTYEMLSTLIVSLEELLDNKPLIPLSQQYVNIVFGEVYDNKNKAEQQLFALTDQFPELIATIQTKQAAHMILVSIKKELEEENHSGSINDDEFADLVERLNFRISRLDYKGLGWEHKDIQEFDVLTPFFKQLDAHHKDLLKENHAKTNFTSGQVLFKKDEPVNGIYILSKGLVEDAVTDDFKCKYGLGSILNWANVVTGEGKARTTVTAQRDSTALFIQRHIIERICNENKDFEEKIYKASLPYLLKLHPPYSSSVKITDEMVVHLQANCTLVSKGMGEMLNVQYGGFLVSGEVKIAEDDSFRQAITYRDSLFISPAGNANFKVVKPIKLLRFNKSILQFDEDQPVVKKSFMAMGGMLAIPGANLEGGPRKSSVRGSFQAMMSKEKDIESLFEDIVRQKFKRFHN